MRWAERLTLGKRAADRLRKGTGSWAFMFAALVFLAVWMALNVGVAHAGRRAFDAYPFTLLNLLLSCLGGHAGVRSF